MTEENTNRSYRRRFDRTYDIDRAMSHKNTDTKGVSKSPGLTDSNKVVKLAQEIQDELLICKICLGNYKQPKSLQCLHTFCAECLENHIQGEVTYKKYSDYREFTCPLCRKRTSLPLGGVRKLPDNFVVVSLYEMIRKQNRHNNEHDDDNESTTSLSANLRCQICQKTPNRKREAYTKCLDCNKLLCKACTDMHKTTKVTKNHSMFDIKIEEDVICKIHPEESIRYFCEPCETCICILCTFNEHKEHEVLQFTEAVSKYKANIEESKIECMGIIEEFEEKLIKIKATETIIHNTEEEITSLASNLIDEIRSREKQLLEEIKNMYGSEMLNVIKDKSMLEVQLGELKNACSMADVVLKRKDVELLLLKKDIQEKLSEMHKLPMTPLPKTSGKIIRFVPGILEFGSIQDMDRPMLTKPKSIKMHFENGSYEVEHSEPPMESSTQTDPTITNPTASKLIATEPIQIRNIAINTVARVIFQKQNPLAIQSLATNTSNLEVKPITSCENINNNINDIDKNDSRRYSCSTDTRNDPKVILNNNIALSTENLSVSKSSENLDVNNF